MIGIVNYNYDAFISYSRRDSRFAIDLQKNIENKFRLLEKKFRKDKRKVHVALDKEDLDSNEDLTLEIRTKLNNSKHLIVLCSENSKKSEWVNKEIKYFKEIREAAADRQIIVINLSLAEPVTIDQFPDELVKEGKIPIAIDVRKDFLKAQRINYKEHYKVNVLRPEWKAYLLELRKQKGKSDLVLF